MNTGTTGAPDKYRWSAKLLNIDPISVRNDIYLENQFIDGVFGIQRLTLLIINIKET